MQDVDISKLKNIEPDMIQLYDMIYVIELGVPVRYEVLSKPEYVDYWIEVKANDIDRTGLDTILKFNPRVPSDIYRTYLGEKFLGQNNY